MAKGKEVKGKWTTKHRPDKYQGPKAVRDKTSAGEVEVPARDIQELIKKGYPGNEAVAQAYSPRLTLKGEPK